MAVHGRLPPPVLFKMANPATPRGPTMDTPRRSLDPGCLGSRPSLVTCPGLRRGPFRSSEVVILLRHGDWMGRRRRRLLLLRPT
ncbi:hypothetical protein HPB47_015747 [Ixodes persulcatus]|uniref:Uncharacterized protein n=1 Tax=Ixodes persulcatus TaxID=34615 RepID=A0AC60QUN2_IXOPE|nr:hypothetical protein HPB47_015747 [Ixodes persulcatus]